MARAKGPLFSLGAHGTLGNTLTYQDNKGVNVVRIKPTPKDKKTTCQTVRQYVYRYGCTVWSSRPDLVTEEEKVLWTEQAKINHRSGFNEFMSAVMLLNIPHCTPRFPFVVPHPDSFVPVSGYFFLVANAYKLNINENYSLKL